MQQCHDRCIGHVDKTPQGCYKIRCIHEMGPKVIHNSTFKPIHTCHILCNHSNLKIQTATGFGVWHWIQGWLQHSRIYRDELF